MISIEDLNKIMVTNNKSMNPAQKLAVIGKAFKLKPSKKIKMLLDEAQADYVKWTKTTSYKKLLKGVIYE